MSACHPQWPCNMQRLADFVAAIPLILLNILALVGLCMSMRGAVGLPYSSLSNVGLISQLTLGVFLCLQIFFLLVRRLPERKLREGWSRAVALIASNILGALIFVPKVGFDALWLTISSAFL